MNRGAILALGAVAVGLLAYILVYEQGSLSTKELQERRGHLLQSFVRDRVSALEIERDGRTLTLTREAGEGGGFESWQVEAPWQEAADGEAVDALLGELEWLDARRRIEDASQADLKSFGLASPRIRLRYTAGDTQGTLEVGGRDVHDEGVYVRRGDGGAVSVVPKTLDEVLDHPLSHFRTKQFMGDLTVAWARHVEIHSAEGEVTLTREDGRFWFERDPRGWGDRRAIETWLRNFDGLRATRYVAEADEAEARASLAKATDRILVKIIPDEGREDVQVRILDVRIGGDCPGHDDERLVIAGEQEPVVCVRDDDLEPLLQGLEGLRLRTPFGFDVSQIESLRFETGKHAIALSRDEDRWVAEGDATVDRATVEGWLADLSDQRALDVAEREQGPTLSSLELHLADGSRWQLELGAPTLSGSVVRRGDEPVELRFDAATADLLTYWPGRFRSLRLWEVQPSQVVALEVRDDAGHARSLRLTEGAWTEVGAEQPPVDAVDAARIREIVAGLVRLEARRIRAPEPAPEHGLREPALTLRATLEGGDQLALAVGAQAESAERHFAQVDGGLVVEIPIEDAAALRELASPPSPQAQTTKPAPTPEDAEHGHEGHAH